jgi:hypothetical protein
MKKGGFLHIELRVPFTAPFDRDEKKQNTMSR